MARLRIEDLFDRLFDNEDEAIYKLAQEVLAGEHAWLEEGALQVIPDGTQLAPETPPTGRKESTGGAISGTKETTQIASGG